MFYHHKQSFTLVEVLVSITLTAIIVIAATGIWISCTRGWNFAQDHERVSEHDDVVTKRVKELFERAMLEKSSRDLFEWKCGNDFDGQYPSDKITFTTLWPFESDHGRTLLVPVRGTLGTQLINGGRGSLGKKLTWSFSPFSADPKDSDQAENIVLSSDIQSINLRYWWKDAARWVDDWREDKKWPDAVEVTLTFADAGSPPRAQKFVVAMPSPTDPVAALDQSTNVPATNSPAATQPATQPEEMM